MKIKTKSKRPLFFGLVFVLSLLVGGFFAYKISTANEKTDINISTLPEEVMDEYFESFSEMAKHDNRENILIVTSKAPLKETYGATQVIDAPNYQYFLQYENEEDKNHALNMFKDSGIKASENKIYKFTDDEAEETTYNSWGIKAMGLDKATGLVEAMDDLPEVTVAIIDTGLDMNLMNKYFPGKVDEVYNVLDPDGEMVDEFGHGTHIAGTIAEGTPSNVKVLPIKVSTGSDLSDVDIITAINYITYYEKADVVNMSFGGYGYDEATEETRVAIEAAKEKGIISVAAAGNEATNEISYPSGFDNTISISAVDSNLSLADYSNYGEMITFAAPGSAIKSIMGSEAEIAQNYEDDGDDDFQTIDGTSMATPHVACAVAVLKSIDSSLEFDAAVDVLKDHAVDLGPNGWDSMYGYGMINFDGIKLCDEATSSDCDAYSIFEKFVPGEIEIGDVVLTPYNYGSLTNILATTISITSTNGETVEKKIGDLSIDDYQVTGYNPYSSEEQIVTLSYSGVELDFEVKNPDEYEFGWEYSDPEYGEIDSPGYALTGYKDHGLNIKTLYFPNTTSDGTPVVSLEDSGSDRCVFGAYSQEEKKCVELVDAPKYTTIVLPDNLRQIGGIWTLGSILPRSKSGALENLERVVSYADELKLLGGNTFAGLKRLYSVEANILFDEESGEDFSGDVMLTDITLSENNIFIPLYVFRDCQSLSEITIPESVEEIDDYAFAGTGLRELHISENVSYIGMGVLESTKQLTSITVSGDSSWYYSPEGSNAIIQTGTDKLVAGSSSTVIPDTVKIIGKGSLLDLDLSEINIPEGVTTIEEKAIFSVDIGKIVLPSSLESISNRAFEGVHHSCASSYRAGACSFNVFAFWVHRDSYALDWAVAEDYGYVIIEELDEGSESKHISWVDLQTRARALDTINDDNTDVYVHFADRDGDSDADPVRATVVGAKYYTGAFATEETPLKHLVAGSNCFKAFFDIDAYHNIGSSTYCMTIRKRIPEYTIPTGLEADPGQKLSAIELPDGFSWKNPNTIITGAGKRYYQAVFTPEDTENYETVNVSICIFVRTDKELIEPTINLSSSVLIRDDPSPITQEEITISGFEPIEGDGDGYEITYFEYTYDDDEEKGYVYVEMRMSDKQFETHYFEGGYQDWGDQIEVDTVYSSNPFIGAYDGEEHSITFNLGERYSQCAITYSSNGDGEYDLTELPMFRETGIYNVYYRVDCGELHYFAGSNTVTITGFIINESILDGDKLRVASNNPADLFNAIQVIGDEEASFRIVNGDGEEVVIDESTILATGYTLEIQVGSETCEFEITLVGDLTGDGLVDDLDLEALKRHLVGTELLHGVYLLAGDISNDDLINSGDLLRLKQHLLGIKLID